MEERIENYQFAFTLVELLVVISIVGILASVVLVSFVGTQKQARDTQRKSDLKQYLTSLENYGSKTNGLYPAYPARVDPNSLCTILTGTSTCPVDPKALEGMSYSYCSDSAGSQYALWATLENVINTFWVVCSNGKVGSSGSIPGCGGNFGCLP